ncbi:Fis family transcriptional regulator, partial [Acinetobacter variabilis]
EQDLLHGNKSSSKSAENFSAQQIITIQQLKDLEIRNLNLAIKQCDGKIFGENGAATLLGINPTTLISKLKKLGIKY